MAPRRKRQRLADDGADRGREQARKQLFVRSLAPTVTTEDLTAFFSDNYPIKHALVVLDKETKQSRGYGFVAFADAEDAQRAKEELDGAELQGKKIRVDTAEPRHRDADVAHHELEEQRQQPREAHGHGQAKLIVRNLPWTIKTPEQLERLFMSYGKVQFVALPKKASGELRGFGFVALRGRKNAEKAMEGLNGKEVDGRPIAVDWAVDKETWQAQEQEQAQALQTETETQTPAEGTDADPDSEGSDDDNADKGSESYDAVIEQDSGDEDDYLSDMDGAPEEEAQDERPQRPPEHSIFIRNLPFTVDDHALFDHFTSFGPLRYARIVVDRDTQRPRGTAFVCFSREADMVNCLRDAPRTMVHKNVPGVKDGTSLTATHSVLENELADPTGRYTMDGRVLNISRAVDKDEAARLTAAGAAFRFDRDKDKRRLYLLSEGTIDSTSPLYAKLSPSEIRMREESAKQRRRQIETNPSLHLSLTRLSVRNIPRSVTSKQLKELARKAVVGFAEDVKLGKREKLSKEELSRGGQAMVDAEKRRKRKGKGIVKQAKVVFETPTGSKVSESSGAGRSRGYGFVEYYTHRTALMGLRWLNGHAVGYQTKEEPRKGKKAVTGHAENKKKRLIVEFAIENANVVHRRSDRETKAGDRPTEHSNADGDEERNVDGGNTGASGRARAPGRKRKRGSVDDAAAVANGKLLPKAQRKGQSSDVDGEAGGLKTVNTKSIPRSHIIQKKRIARRVQRKRAV